jgi:hypothetical protein
MLHLLLPVPWAGSGPAAIESPGTTLRHLLPSSSPIRVAARLPRNKLPLLTQQGSLSHRWSPTKQQDLAAAAAG